MSRLDQSLVERGLCDSREKAKRLILAGQARINGQTAHKPSDSVKPADEISLDAPEKFVSRGGHKLEHALNHFQITVTGLTAIDLGASTGGFTDCLLQHGAEKVFAVDVGQGQLAWKLRQDPRVVVMEKTNARYLTCNDFKARIAPPSPLNGERAGVRGGNITEALKEKDASEKNHPSPSVPLPVEGRGKKEQVPTGKLTAGGNASPAKAEPPADLIVVDCSFISLKKILPPAVPLLKPGCHIVALIKPQFEAGKAEADKGRGVIIDAAVHQRVLAELKEFVTAQAGLCWRGVVESPLLGPAGNKEFLALIEKVR
jgi:predicted rRNA methylase YqxC with S4 and FtsJ domains